ncbi:MAG: FAD binding domain-containing protein [Anaerolineae bacterium]|nr:FAD binding domain-containing protein [Anaerolineae bacterium]
MRNLTTIHRPTTVEEAVNLLRNGASGTAILAGGTGLVGEASPAVEAVVDLAGLDLAYVRAEADGLRLGAMTTLHDLTRNSALQGWAGGQLARAAHAATSSSLLRRQATICGSLISASAPELAALLIALGTQVTIYRPGASQAPLEALYQDGLTETPFLLTEVYVPRHKGLGVASQAVRRTPGDAPIVAVTAALALEDGRVRYIGLGAGGAVIAAPDAPKARTSGWPTRLAQTEHGLLGQRLTNQLVAAAVAQAPGEMPAITDYLASAEYRTAMVGTLLRRALGEAWRAALDTRS